MPNSKPEKFESLSNYFYFSYISPKEISDRILDLSIYKAKESDNIIIKLLR